MVSIPRSGTGLGTSPSPTPQPRPSRPSLSLHKRIYVRSRKSLSILETSDCASGGEREGGRVRERLRANGCAVGRYGLQSTVVTLYTHAFLSLRLSPSLFVSFSSFLPPHLCLSVHTSTNLQKYFKPQIVSAGEEEGEGRRGQSCFHGDADRTG